MCSFFNIKEDDLDWVFFVCAYIWVSVSGASTFSIVCTTWEWTQGQLTKNRWTVRCISVGYICTTQYRQQNICKTTQEICNSLIWLLRSYIVTSGNPSNTLNQFKAASSNVTLVLCFETSVFTVIQRSFLFLKLTRHHDILHSEWINCIIVRYIL